MQEKPIKTVELPEQSDGVYKVRTGMRNEKLIQVRAGSSGEYRRFTKDDGNLIIFVRV